jgi:hypothetical protein
MCQHDGKCVQDNQQHHLSCGTSVTSFYRTYHCFEKSRYNCTKQQDFCDTK